MRKEINIVAVGLLLGFGVQAYGITYDFTFTGGGVVASGWFDAPTLGGVVTDGEVDVTGAALNGTFGWVQGPTVRAVDGTDIIFDNVFSPAADPALDGKGLGFANGYMSPGHYDGVVNIWGNSPGNYSLFEAGGSVRAYNEYDGGTLRVTERAIPDGGITAAMLGMSMLGLGLVRRQVKM
jgi:hypothetical protein